MSALKAILEDFEQPGVLAPVASSADDVRIQNAASDAYAEGYAAGQAAAASQASAQSEALDNTAMQLNAVFANLSAEIRVQFCDALKAAIEKVFPMLADKGFAENCAAAVADAAGLGDAEDRRAQVTIKAAPARAELLEAAFARLELGDHIRIKTDDGLSDLEIKAGWENAGLELDFDAAISQSLAALDHTIAQINDRT